MPNELAILHVAPIWGDPSQGLTEAIQALALAQRKLSREVRLLSTAPFKPDGLKKQLEVLWIRDLSSAEQKRLIEEADLVVFHSTYIWAHRRLSHQARSLGVPYIIVPHGGMTELAANRSALKKRIADLCFYRSYVEHAIGLHCLTEGERMATQRWHKEIFVVGNGSDTPTQVRLREFVPDCCIEVLYIGRLAIQQKGLDLMISGFAQFISRNKNASIRLSLYGPDDLSSRIHLQSMIDQSGLGENVVLRDPVYGEQKLHRLDEADVFCMTSRFEGHPMAMLEAMASGLPCIASSGTNLEEAILAAGAGWGAGTTESDVAVAFEQVFQQRTKLSDFSRAAVELAKSYTWAKCAEQSLSHYSRLLASR